MVHCDWEIGEGGRLAEVIDISIPLAVCKKPIQSCFLKPSRFSIVCRRRWMAQTRYCSIPVRRFSSFLPRQWQIMQVKEIIIPSSYETGTLSFFCYIAKRLRKWLKAITLRIAVWLWKKKIASRDLNRIAMERRRQHLDLRTTGDEENVPVERYKFIVQYVMYPLAGFQNAVKWKDSLSSCWNC